ncbi:RING-H2 finger protein ATL5-like isoform X2 [Punica granatum]|uniref:RING-H2 finger protein ATL5-like isoform X2 n=1 Tax=Punica granatum TaxID=22663 RepID=A0A6P8CVM9_PUNGR|nr:RING-H2 finger protein ATL5-like isoform X2 [Punica granatum]
MGLGSSKVSTIIGFGLSALFISFIFMRLLCRRLRRAQSRPVLEVDPTIDVEQQNQLTGLEPVLVEKIATTNFSRDTFSAEDAQCSICLGEYQEKEVLRIMPKCGHNFHLVCVDVWLRRQSTCPVCRLPLIDLIGMKDVGPATANIPR